MALLVGRSVIAKPLPRRRLDDAAVELAGLAGVERGAGGEFGPARRQQLEPERPGEAVLTEQRSVAGDQQGRRRAGAEQGRETGMIVEHFLGGGGEPAAAPGRPQRHRQPGSGEEGDKDERIERQDGHRALSRASLRKEANGFRRP